MTAQDRTRWDQVYREQTDAFPPPDPLLFEFTPPLLDATTEQRALDVAAGVGQNGLWLAAQGYVVDMIDVSRVALLRVIEPADQTEWAGVGALMQEEGREEAERLLSGLAAQVNEMTGGLPILLIREGDPRDELLALIAEGYTNRAIGEVLHLSEKTVRNHVSQLLRKLGFQRRSQAAAWAGQRRLELPPD